MTMMVVCHIARTALTIFIGAMLISFTANYFYKRPNPEEQYWLYLDRTSINALSFWLMVAISPVTAFLVVHRMDYDSLLPMFDLVMTYAAALLLTFVLLSGLVALWWPEKKSVPEVIKSVTYICPYLVGLGQLIIIYSEV